MIVAVDAGNFGTAGAADVKSCVNTVRYGTLLGTSQLHNFLNAGLKVNLLMPGATPTGGYSTGGVRTINTASWASGALSYYQANCTPSNTPILEVLNEPGGTWFWGVAQQADADNYARLLKAVWTAFHNAYGSSAPLIIASYDGGNSGGSPWGSMWWNSTAVSGIAGFVDGVTIHPYGGASGGNGGANGNRSSVTNAHTQTNKPVYVTELGWPTATGQPATGDSQQWSEAQQASNVTNFAAWAAGTGYVAEFVCFNYRDFGSNNWYGITRTNGTHKPSFTALHNASVTYDTGGGTPPPVSSVTIQLNPANAAQIQVTSVPAGTLLLHLGEAQDVGGTGLQFPGPGVDPGSAGSGVTAPFTLPLNFTPPADHPAVQVLAYDSAAYSGGVPSGNALGQWTPFVLTTPASGSLVPTAVTDAASGISGGNVTLNGHADLKGQSTGSFHFEVARLIGGVAGTATNYPAVDTAITGSGSTTSPTVISAGIASGTTDTTGSITITKPGGQWADGQKLLLFVETKASGTTDPVITGGVSGWTLWGAQNFQVANLDRTIKLSVYTRTASSEPASYTITQTEALSMAGTVVPVLNFGSIDAGSKFKVNGSAQTFPLDSQVPVHNGDLLLGAAAFPNGENFDWVGATEASDVKSGTSTASAALTTGQKAITSDGTVGTVTASVTLPGNATGADTSCTVALVLRPAAAASGTIVWPVTGLTAGAYQYRLSVTTSNGTDVDPNWVTFNITGKPEVTGLSVSQITDTTAHVAAHIDPLGASTTWRVEVSTDGGVTWTVAIPDSAPFTTPQDI